LRPVSRPNSFHRTAGIASVLAGLALALASPASAVTVGQVGKGPATDACSEAFDLVQPTVTSGTSYVVPSTGGVTNWTVTTWSTDPRGQTGQSMAVKFFRLVSGPATYQVVGHEGPHPLAPTLNTFQANFQVKAGDVLGVHTGGGECAFDSPGEHILYSPTDLADGASAPFLTDQPYRVNASAQVEPTGDFTLKKPKTKANGTAVLPVTVPNPGVLTVSGGGAAKSSSAAAASKQVPSAGTVKLKIKAKGLKKRQLARKGKVTVKPKITFTPTGGIPESLFRKIKLHRS
jgi:hypothetical protein